MNEAVFASTIGRDVRILQLVAPAVPTWALFVDEEETLSAESCDVLYDEPVVLLALVEWCPAGAERAEQDIVAVVATELGEFEIAQDEPGFAGLTTNPTDIETYDVVRWQKNWRARNAAREAIASMQGPRIDLVPTGSPEEG